MRSTLAVLALLAAPLLSLLVSALTYALRDLSRVRLAEELGKRSRDRYYDSIIENAGDLSFITGTARLVCNFVVLLAMIDLSRNLRGSAEIDAVEYLFAVTVSTLVLVVMSLALPRAIANHAGEEVIAIFAPSLDISRRVAQPVTRLLHQADKLVLRARPARRSEAEHDSLVQEEILDAVSEGTRLGAVDDRQRELIESVISFRDLTVDEIMTPRQNVIALPITASFDDLVRRFEESGHSRLPIYEQSIDHIAGVVYARDLLRYITPEDHVDEPKLRGLMRTPLIVPRTKPVADLLTDFRLEKIHIAIVLDEYGGTAGLVTIEDVVEQLVGDISDEHEPQPSNDFHRLGPDAGECDAKLRIEDVNRLLGLSLPEDEDYETLGGFVTTTMQRIPEVGAKFEAHGATFTVLAAEPTRVTRVKIELLARSRAAAARG